MAPLLERFIFDKQFQYYYQTYLAEGILLNIFIARGVQRNTFIENIYFQDFDPPGIPLASAELSYNVVGEKFWVII